MSARPDQPVYGRARERGLVSKGPVCVARASLQTIGTFFHPLDGIRNWNRVYGPAGFRQYQFVVPFGAESTVRASLERISHARAPSFVTVLKRFGPGDDGFLSFPMPGWTLALDFPARTPGLASLLIALRRRRGQPQAVAFYLAKDSRIAAGTLAAMYPRLAEFRALRAELDPAGVMASDLSRRASGSDDASRFHSVAPVTESGLAWAALPGWRGAMVIRIGQADSPRQAAG